MVVKDQEFWDEVERVRNEPLPLNPLPGLHQKKRRLLLRFQQLLNERRDTESREVDKQLSEVRQQIREHGGNSE